MRKKCLQQGKLEYIGQIIWRNEQNKDPKKTNHINKEKLVKEFSTAEKYLQRLNFISNKNDKNCSIRSNIQRRSRRDRKNT